MRYSDSSQITIRLGVVAVFFESYLLILIADWPPLKDSNKRCLSRMSVKKMCSKVITLCACYRSCVRWQCWRSGCGCEYRFYVQFSKLCVHHTTK